MSAFDSLLTRAGFAHLSGSGYGRKPSTCPACSHTRSPENRHVKCCTVYIEPNCVGWNCHHCNDKGRLIEGGDVERGVYVPPQNVERVPLKHIPWDVAWPTIKRAQKRPSAFHTWFINLMGADAAAQVLGEYHVGVNKDGYTVFWLVDDTDNPRQPRVTRFTPAGNTCKGYPKRKGWVPKEYRTAREISPGVWVDTGYRPCLFGEHLLPVYPNAPIALVEAEKTALVGRALHPEWVWIGLNGSSNFNRAVGCPWLKNRLVFTLFDPDKAGRKCGKEVLGGLRGKMGPHGAIQVIDTWPGVDSGFNLADWAAGQEEGELMLDLDINLRHPAHAPAEMWHTFWRLYNALNAWVGQPPVNANSPTPAFLHLDTTATATQSVI